MTYEQALEIKQNLTPEQVRNDLERYLLRGEAPIIKGVAMAMQALEKQIPKKLILDKANLTDFQDFYCPSCNKKIISKLDGEWIAGRLQKHCDDCGQALDWDKR